MSRFKPYRKAVDETLHLHESEAGLWHGILFLLNIGVPVLAGLCLGAPGAGIAGGLVGLFFSLSDCNGKWNERQFMLLRALGMILFFGVLGHAFGGYTRGFWLTFIALTFGTGWLSLTGSPHTSALRYGAMTLIFMAEIPRIASLTVAMVLLAAAVSALTRTAGYFFFPEAPAVTIPRSNIEPLSRLAGFRFCLAYAATVGTALLLGESEGVTRPLWVVTTVLLVMQPEARSTYQRVVQRALGTLLGVAVAALIIGTIHSLPLLTVVVLIIAFLVPQGSTRNYWLHSAMTALLVLVLYDFAASARDFDERLLGERFRDVSLGCILACIGTLFAFPPRFGGGKNVLDSATVQASGNSPHVS